MSFEDTPNLAVYYCPTCEPNRDPLDGILDIRWCHMHTPSWAGTDDDAVQTNAFLSGSNEAGGYENSRWCELLHRGRR